MCLHHVCLSLVKQNTTPAYWGSHSFAPYRDIPPQPNSTRSKFKCYPALPLILLLQPTSISCSPTTISCSPTKALCLFVAWSYSSVAVTPVWVVLLVPVLLILLQSAMSGR